MNCMIFLSERTFHIQVFLCLYQSEVSLRRLESFFVLDRETFGICSAFNLNRAFFAVAVQSCYLRWLGGCFAVYNRRWSFIFCVRCDTVYVCVCIPWRSYVFHSCPHWILEGTSVTYTKKYDKLRSEAVIKVLESTNKSQSSDWVGGKKSTEKPVKCRAVSMRRKKLENEPPEPQQIFDRERWKPPPAEVDAGNINACTIKPFNSSPQPSVSTSCIF